MTSDQNAAVRPLAQPSPADEPAAGNAPLPQPAPQPPPIVEPRDEAYPGVIRLWVDASDVTRGIVAVRQTIPVARPGRLTLLYPKWMPGYHSPQNPIELFAGLEVRAGDELLAWRRDPVEVYAFHLDVPRGVEALDVCFQFLSPTSSTQGDVVVTSDMLNLQWGRVALYPAGHFTRRIEVEAAVDLPQDWVFATVLEVAMTDGSTTVFKPVALDVLVDSPLMAGRHGRDVPLDETGAVRMQLLAHDPAHLGATPQQLEGHRALVAQADRLFGARHFDSYWFLTALTEELGGGGVEHHRSAEIVAPPTYFTDWDRNYSSRDVFAHEFVHSWNGKFRRGADSWQPTFQEPIRNSLMWVYEGQTQYWGHVLTARAGLWTLDAALGALAKVAATYDVRPGGLWRTLADTTRDPIIAGRDPQPWASWQRNEDYYSEGQLIWLAVDTLIRERSGDARSLDDFARAFFGCEPGRTITRTYDFDEVIRTLDAVQPCDWAGLLTAELERRQEGAPLEGLARGGYRLVYREVRNGFCRSFDAAHGQFDMRFSIGLNLSDNGAIQEVMWDSPAFHAGLTAGAQIDQVGGQDYSEQVIGDAIEAAAGGGGPIELSVTVRGRSRAVRVDYDGGHRFPHLEPIEGARRRLDEIYAPR